MLDLGNYNLHGPGPLIIYLIPSVVAVVRNHDHRFEISALNLVLGWTGIGWIGALVWAIYKPVRV